VKHWPILKIVGMQH